MFDTEDPRNIWVSPTAGSGGLGGYDDPFASVSDALKKTSPGQTVVLMPGVYHGDLTIEVSGDENSPVYVTAHGGGEVVIDGGCWYFYDTSDLVVSGMTFRNAPHGAISVVGQCLRNRFHSIRFEDCGTDKKASCAFYFGGAGGRFNIVENCEFLRPADMDGSSRGGGSTRPPSVNELSADNAVVGLMISDGGGEHPIKNHVIRHNHFVGYGMPIIIGTGELPDGFDSGHIVERNWVEDCPATGITVKCGDVLVRGNVLDKCAAAGIALSGGEYSIVDGNSIYSCAVGVSVEGPGHTVTGNIIAACGTAVSAAGNNDGLIDYDNTILNELPASGAPNDWDGDDEDHDEGYLQAAIAHDDDDDAVVDDEDDDVHSEMEAVLKYMFDRD